MSKIRPFKHVFLATGYVETQSRAVLVLTHRKGFKKLTDLYDSLSKAFARGHGKMLEYDSIDSDKTLDEVIFDYIWGDPQDNDQEVWEALEDADWTEVLPKTFGRYKFMDRAPEILSENYKRAWADE